jgi:uncharacterized protein
MRQNSWSGKQALITGASSGIGAATARLLAGRGLRVILTARRVDRLQSLAKELQASGGSAEVLSADLEQSEDRARLTAEVLQRFGCPDVLVNNAGIGWYGYYADMSPELAHKMLELNVCAVMDLTRQFLPHMRQRHSGAIINISSIAGSIPSQGIAMYSGTKAFLNAFTTSLHREMRRSGVSISVLQPGPVQTEFFDLAASQPNGRRVPAGSLGISAGRVAEAVWSLMRRPRRQAFVPWFTRLTPWVSLLFAGIMDWLGPMLLRRS